MSKDQVFLLRCIVIIIWFSIVWLIGSIIAWTPLVTEWTIFNYWGGRLFMLVISFLIIYANVKDDD